MVGKDDLGGLFQPDANEQVGYDSFNVNKGYFSGSELTYEVLLHRIILESQRDFTTGHFF